MATCGKANAVDHIVGALFPPLPLPGTGICMHGINREDPPYAGGMWFLAPVAWSGLNSRTVRSLVNTVDLLLTSSVGRRF